MSKDGKKTILKQIFKNIKRKEPFKTSDDVIKDATLKKGKKQILKVINKENINHRITDLTLGDGKASVNNSEGDEITLREANFQVNKPDYTIEDLTKKEEIEMTDVKPPIESEIDINEILKDLDGKLEEKQYNHVLNILATRSSKEGIKGSALVEYSICDKSYVMSLIVEKDQNNVCKVALNNSYGKSIYLKENLDINDVKNAVLFPFNAIALREKVLKEQINK